MKNGISIRVRGLQEVEAFLKSLPRGVMKVALGAIATYLIGDERHGLRHYEPYKYVSRASAYGKVSDAPPGYFNWAQFFKVRGMIQRGEITPGKPNRTGKAADSWGYSESRGGYGVSILNADPGAYYTRDDKGQARQPAKVGWRKTAVVIASNMAGAMRSAMAEVHRWIEGKR